jgi:pyruvyl transferase EpsO
MEGKPEPSHASLRRQIDARLSELLEPGSEVALLNFPNIGNVGDSAIWLGARHALRRAGVRVRYRSEPATYSPRLLTRSVGEHGTVLLQGGGNLGDVHPNQQRVREQVLRDFPRARVVQLPQSAWFRSESRAREFARIAEAHDDFTLMLRERRSLEWAESAIAVPRTLCPDLALALPPIPREPPAYELLWLLRRDRERSRRRIPPLGPADARMDWRRGRGMRRSGPRRLRLLLAANRRVTGATDAHERVAPFLWWAAAATFDPIARERLSDGARRLGRGRVVITDRLHGHLLALLMGIPHVLLDSASGKCRAFWETWTSELPLASWADEPEEALAIARARLQSDGAVS